MDGRTIAYILFGVAVILFIIMAIWKGQKDAPHQCPICGEMFKEYDDFIYHIRRHAA